MSGTERGYQVEPVVQDAQEEGQSTGLYDCRYANPTPRLQLLSAAFPVQTVRVAFDPPAAKSKTRCRTPRPNCTGNPFDSAVCPPTPLPGTDVACGPTGGKLS
eukprot:308414-Rhodomonas_salina.2